MMLEIDKILDFIKQTKDRYVLSYRGEHYIIMSFSEYQKLWNKGEKSVDIVDLTEDELIGKINQDISQWRMKQVEDTNFFPYVSEKNRLKEQMPYLPETGEDQYYLEPVD